MAKIYTGYLVVLLGIFNVQCQQRSIQQLLGGQAKFSDACTYLQTRTSIWDRNNSPFLLSVKGHYGLQVRSGEPIEVKIEPWDKQRAFNFTDFIVYGTQSGMGQIGMMQMGPPMPFLGVWEIYPKYAAGGRGFMCNDRAMGHDAFGSGEERKILIQRALDPKSYYWYYKQPALRQYASSLWYPTEMVMTLPSIQFVAKLKSDGHWYEIKSKHLNPYIPPDPMSTMFNSLASVSHMSQHMRQLERQMDQQTAGL